MLKLQKSMGLVNMDCKAIRVQEESNQGKLAGRQSIQYLSLVCHHSNLINVDIAVMNYLLPLKRILIIYYPMNKSKGCINVKYNANQVIAMTWLHVIYGKVLLGHTFFLGPVSREEREKRGI